MKFCVLLLAAAGCASGSSALGQDDANPALDGSEIDAATAIDATPIDAPPPIDAMVDAPPDATPDAAPPDACVPVVTQLLANPVLDLTPMGTGWQQQVIDAMYPLITDQDGIAEQTAPYKAWLGGLEAPTGSVTDVLYQDFTIPANTTQLRLTGFYEVRTSEDVGDLNVYDTGSIGFTQTNGTPIAMVNSFSNITPTTAWTAISYTFPQTMSGQTIRLRMQSSNDILNPTSFFFDSFALNATHCP
jgi:hypothetical protein